MILVLVTFFNIHKNVRTQVPSKQNIAKRHNDYTGLSSSHNASWCQCFPGKWWTCPFCEQDVKKMQLIRPGHLLSFLWCPVLMLTCPLYCCDALCVQGFILFYVKTSLNFPVSCIAVAVSCMGQNWLAFTPHACQWALPWPCTHFSGCPSLHQCC